MILDFGYGWLKARYRKLDPAIIGTFGTPVVNPLKPAYAFVNSPRHSLALGVTYRILLQNEATLTLRTDLRYRSRVANDAVNSPEVMQSPVTLLNGRVTYTSSKKHWAVALFGTNLTNRGYITSGALDEAGFGTGEVNVARPRELGVQVKVEL